MTKHRFLAIMLIFSAAAVAWTVLGSTLEYRTASLEDSLSKEVDSLWGPSDLVQNAPYVQLTRGERIEPAGTLANVEFDHHNRYKGLLWFSTYTVKFDASYTLQLPADTGRGVFSFALPAKAAFFENLYVTLDGKPVKPTYKSANNNTLLVPIPAGERHELAVSYTTRGRDRWRYALGHDKDEPVQVNDFNLTATTNFKKIDYPAGCKSPSKPAKPNRDNGMETLWQLDNVRMSQKVGIEMPARLNAGPIAARMSMFAPVSLFFFFTVLFTIVVLKKLPLHPMHYLFISAGFFAFHVLLAYLVDIVNIHVAFWTCSVVSVLLVVSYMRLVAGVRFAIFYVGVAQLVYLIGFSYAFFYPGHTGLTVVIGAIITLFLLMQLTGRIEWNEVFGRADSFEREMAPRRSMPETAAQVPPLPGNQIGHTEQE